MRAKRQILTSVLVLYALAVPASLGLVQIALASQAQAQTRLEYGPSGWRGINKSEVNGKQFGDWTTLRPQSDLALLRQATKLGPHARDATIEVTVGLKLHDVAQLKTFLQEVQSPASPLYHQFLTPKQFTARYGPSKAEVAKVVAFLKANGIKVTSVSPNRTLIHTEATTRAYEHAFEIGINDYSLKGRSFYSTADKPKLPRALAPLVSNILGFNHGVQMHPRSRLHAKYKIGPSPSPQAAPPASTAYFEPRQIAKAYDWPDITDAEHGGGVSIAILTAETPGVDNNPNYHRFWTSFGLPDHTINVIPIGGPSASGGEPETALDIEWSGAMAPGATLNVYVAANGSSDIFTEMYNRFVTDNNSQVMTTSWGLGESGAPDVNLANEQIFMQAAAQGISMFAAAGDNGASDCAPPPGYCPPGPNNADFPSSSEYITAANGTELSISDKSGTYGSEQASIHTGGGISELFDKPTWQTGPGVPADVDMRMNSDMGLNYGSVHPYLILLNGPQGLGYYGIGGTSAVAPILSGLFAIGVSEQPGGASLGQSNSLIYNDVNANDTNYASDFHDVTAGCNGYLPDGTTESCAGTGWDHPTGWGSPKGKSLLSHIGVHGPAGVLKGTVTDAASGAPATSATVTVAADGVSESRLTKSDGSYLLALPVGSYTVTVTDYGYKRQSGTVTINNGEIATQNFSLVAASTATISGRVTDGSGHGYGLYAEVKATVSGFGQVADVWSDPVTGAYNLDLPRGSDYSLVVTPYLDGYKTSSTTITNLSKDTHHHFSLMVTSACTAPGYALPFGEDFDKGFPPAGWTVTNGVKGSKVRWKTNTDWSRDNYTGGAGKAADADSNAAGSSSAKSYDTSLVTPALAVTMLGPDPTLSFDLNYQRYSESEALDVDINPDGKGWQTVAHLISDYGKLYSLPGDTYSVELAPYIKGATNVRLRWRYYNLSSDYDWYAQIDNVSIGNCRAIPGGLIMGSVSDGKSGDGIVGATVSDRTGSITATFENMADSGLPVGYYFLFASAGKHMLTVSANGHSPDNKSIEVINNQITQQNFSLLTGHLTGKPAHYDLHIPAGTRVQKTFSVKNTGAGEAHFMLKTINATQPTTTPASATSGSEWRAIAPYPTPVLDNCMAMDNGTGLVYSVDGSDATGYPINSVYAYIPDSDQWKPAAGNGTARDRPACAFIDGKLYVVNGLNLSGQPSAALEIYDPGSDDWSSGASNPAALGVGSVAVVLDGKLYVIGGCDSSSCGYTTVEVYDPVADSWQAAAPYPEPISWQACGAINGEIYCAGGIAGNAETAHAYAYNPATNRWSPIAPMPYDNWGMAYMAYPGGLLVSQGVTGGNTVTSQGVVYHPYSNSWSGLKDAKNPTYRMGSACGFYAVGGLSPGPVVNARRLPGYSQCAYTPIPWLVMAPATATVAAGATAKITLSFDGSAKKPNTTSQAQLFLVSKNTSDPSEIVPLTVHWESRPVDLVVTGSARPNPVKKGGKVTYSIKVTNEHQADHGDAHEVTLGYTLPDGAEFIQSASSDSCALANNLVSCKMGNVKLNDGESVTVTIAVKAEKAGTLTSHFAVTAREPNGSDKNTLDLKTTVIGDADVGIPSMPDTSLSKGGTGKVRMVVANAGPDTATDVKLDVSTQGSAKLQNVASEQGSCTAAAGGAFNCDFGEIKAGGKVGLTLSLFGTSAGSATVQGQLTTSADDPDPKNNVASATVTVKAASSGGGKNSGGGGGALGWLALAALFGLASSVAGRRYRRRRP